MTPINFYTDEDVSGVLIKALQRRGYKVSTTPGHGRCGRLDQDQLEYASSLGMVLFTHDLHDFPRLHYEWIKQGKEHSGIIVARKEPVGQLLRKVLHLASRLSVEHMRNRLEYLSNW